MLTDVVTPLSGEYRTGSEQEPIAFYMDALIESTRLDLLLGYFSSSAISVLSLGFAKFLSNGGRVRMVINHILSQQDKDAILAGRSTDEQDYQFTIEDFTGLKNNLDTYGRHFFECIAWLVASKRIEIVAVRPRGDRGISHYKSGVFYDGTHEIKFQSSCNFTASGLLENLEELFVKCSWKTHGDQEAIREYHAYFDQIFNQKAEFIECIPFEAIEVAIQNEFGDRNLNELLVQEEQLIRKKALQSYKPFYQKVLDRAQESVVAYLREPKFPYPTGPREYQMQAYDQWCKNDKHGIFAMATGTGKTITALNCVLTEYKQNPEKTYHAVILVPTISLVEQWEKEAKAFNFQNIIKVSSKTEWKPELSSILTSLRFGGSHSLVPRPANIL